MKKFLPITKIILGDEEIQAALEVLKSGNLRQGKKTEEFEKAFAQKTGAEFAVAVSSGTAALHIAYLSLINPGDEVLVPAFSHISTASMVCFANGKPVFCDVNPKTFTIDLDEIKRKITKKTKAIVPVHIFGNACEIDEIFKISGKHNLKVIWDAAQAHMTEYKGKDVGNFDDVVCYSFYPTKNMITGEGGMLTTNNTKLYEKFRLLRSHGQVKKYYHSMLGLNYRMTEVEATIGREQLKRLDQMIILRRRNGQMLNECLSNIPGLYSQVLTNNTKHSYHQYCILVIPDEFGYNRDELAEMLKNRGISTGVHYPRGLHQQPIFEEMFGKQTLEVTEYLCKHILALPVHHALAKEEVQYIINAINQIYNMRCANEK